MRWGKWTSSVAVALALAACSNGDAESTPTTVAPPDPTTTVTPTSPPPTTEPTPPTTPPPTTTSTTLAPTTTLDPEAQPLADAEAETAAQVAADYLETSALIWEADQNPDDDELYQQVLARHTGPGLGFVEERLDARRAANYVSKPNPAVESTTTIEIAPHPVEGFDDVYELQSCEVDAFLIYERGTGPGGTDALVSDEVVAWRYEVRLRLEDGIWKILSGLELERSSGSATCPA